MPSDTPTHSRDYFHGLLNLEQQKRRAKDLLKSARASDVKALARFQEHLPENLGTAPEALKLADAQVVIARENGFSSWPRLKQHCDLLQERRRQADAGTLPILDTPDTVHIRCGSDIQHGLQLAGFVGTFQEFADPFCQGPLPDGSEAEFRASRAQFVSEAYGIELADATARQRLEYAAFTNASDKSHVVMWFEHDSYDQLILAYLLNHFATAARPTTFELICVDSVPGIQGFTGLGQLAPEMLVWLWENQRRPVTGEDITCGTRVWASLRSPDPSILATVANEGTPSLPPMAGALKRHLRELPARRNGLSLTQELILQILSDKGAMTGGKLFGQLMRNYEPLPFLGDLMFWHALVDLQNASITPLQVAETHEPWPRRSLDITAYGSDLLKGVVDYQDSYQGERWVGGVRITPRDPDAVSYRSDVSDTGAIVITTR
ncbi:MAG: DUF1835 domain-containing protein [Alphaproteobacteria bacterium]|nr:DUF1835 domain-containing protein [Alphaproteobacteria bacterium]